MKTMSFNILCGGRGHREWKNRISLVIKTIKNKMPDTFGVQEAHYQWMTELVKNLPEYGYAGVGRDDGDKDGEFSAIFYLKEKYELVEQDSFWLSETPDKPSKGWDGVCIRICSYAKLREKSSGRELFHFNTHLDHVGQQAMVNGARLITEKIAAVAGEMPYILTGDFNVEKSHDAYKVIVDAGIADARFIAEESDTAPTFHLFDSLNGKETTIDYIFIRPNTNVTLFEVIKDRYDGEAPSDHNPVYAEIVF